MKKIILTTVLAALGSASALSGQASAADLGARPYTKAPAMVEAAYNWSGFYAGLNAGGVFASDNNTFFVGPGAFAAAAIAGVNASGSGTTHSSGFIGGGQIGYNWQAGSTVWGIEADFEGLSTKKTSGGIFHYTTNNAPYSLTETFSSDWLMTIRPRLGWTTGQALWYVTGGLALIDRKFNQAFDDNVTGIPELNSHFNQVTVGWTAGAGVEAAVANNWTVKAEYLFARFEPKATADKDQVLLVTFNNSDKLDMHIARLGVNYRFGGPAAKY